MNHVGSDGSVFSSKLQKRSETKYLLKAFISKFNIDFQGIPDI